MEVKYSRILTRRKRCRPGGSFAWSRRTVAVFLIVLMTSGASLAQSAAQEKTASTRLTEFQAELDSITTLHRQDPLLVASILDSLYDVSLGFETDLAQAYVFFHQAGNLASRNLPDQAEQLFNRALTLSQKHHDIQLNTKIYRQLGSMYHSRGASAQALESFYAAIEQAEKVNDFRSIGACYSLIGNIFRVFGDYYKAIEFILQAEGNYKRADFKEGYAWISFSLGNIYKDLDLFKDATRYYEQGLEAYKALAEISGDSLGVAICINQLGSVYFEQGEFELARDLFYRAHHIYEQADNRFGFAVTLKNLGKVEYMLGQYDSSLELLKFAHELNQQGRDVFGMATIYEYMGQCLYMQGHHQAGIDSMEVGLSYAQTTNQRQMEQRLYGALAKHYYEQGLMDNAFEYFQRQADLTDSLKEKSATMRIAELKNIYEMEQRRQRIADLETENELTTLKLQRQRIMLWVVLLGSAVLILFSVSVGYQYVAKRKALALVEAQRAELEKLIATKDKFFSIISHDLRGPLGTIMQTLETFLEMFPEMSRDDILDMLKSMESTSTQTFRLLENLLIWSRFQTGRLLANPERIALDQLTDNLLEMHRSTAMQKEIAIHKNIPKDLNCVADPDMLATILRNLLSNALKFTHAGGTVELKGYQDAQHIVLDVKDSGIGIPQSKLPGLFNLESGFRRRGTQGEKSSGLGLLLVKEFVDALQGQINVTSEEGIGTVFSIRIPAS